jgi:hypothetical protein
MFFFSVLKYLKQKYLESIHCVEISYRCRWWEVHLLIIARKKRLLIPLTVYHSSVLFSLIEKEILWNSFFFSLHMNYQSCNCRFTGMCETMFDFLRKKTLSIYALLTMKQRSTWLFYWLFYSFDDHYLLVEENDITIMVEFFFFGSQLIIVVFMKDWELRAAM